MLPWGIPFSCFLVYDKVLFTLTLHVLSDRKFCMNSGSLPRSPSLCKSFTTPCLHVKSYAFSKSKNTDITCSPFANACRIAVSSPVKWSIVERLFIPPVWITAKSDILSSNNLGVLYWGFSLVSCRRCTSVKSVGNCSVNYGFCRVSGLGLWWIPAIAWENYYLSVIYWRFLVGKWLLLQAIVATFHMLSGPVQVLYFLPFSTRYPFLICWYLYCILHHYWTRDWCIRFLAIFSGL